MASSNDLLFLGILIGFYLTSSCTFEHQESNAEEKMFPPEGEHPSFLFPEPRFIPIPDGPQAQLFIPYAYGLCVARSEYKTRKQSKTGQAPWSTWNAKDGFLDLRSAEYSVNSRRTSRQTTASCNQSQYIVVEYFATKPEWLTQHEQSVDITLLPSGSQASQKALDLEKKTHPLLRALHQNNPPWRCYSLSIARSTVFVKEEGSESFVSLNPVTHTEEDGRNYLNELRKQNKTKQNKVF